jgi:dienelactone hydrolase
MKKQKYLLTSLFIIILFSTSSFAQHDITGYWNGGLKMLNMNIEFQLEVKKMNDSLTAFLNIPVQGLNDYKLSVFHFKNPKVYFEIPGPAGIAKFTGKLKVDSISGTLTQTGVNGSFHLGKILKQTNVTKEPINTEPLPYLEEEVKFKDRGIMLSGTLTRPEEDKKYPAVILLAGSGPQNRDEEVFGFKVFQKIADYLTKKGIVVLRYDKRGTGGSTGNYGEATTEDFTNDAIAAVDFIKKQPFVDEKKIGLLGHSEGGIEAPMAASISNDIAFIILMSGSGVNGGDILLEQQKMNLIIAGASGDVIKENNELQETINNALRSDKDIESIRKDLTAFEEKDFQNLSPEIKASIQDEDTFIKSKVQAQINAFNSPWFRYYVKYDPIPALEKVKVPVLMTFGELDMQVTAAQNKSKMEEALKRGGNNNFKSIVFPKANHLYQEAKTGSPNEYADLPKEFVPGFLETIASWILRVRSY